MMIKEAYCSFEVAKLLKEKGFKEEVSKGLEEEVSTCYFFDSEAVSMPTHQTAMAWLRENKINIDIETCYEFTNKNEDYKVTGYEFTIHSSYDPCYENHKTYDSYESAVEAALGYVLKNLI